MAATASTRRDHAPPSRTSSMLVSLITKLAITGTCILTSRRARVTRLKASMAIRASMEKTTGKCSDRAMCISDRSKDSTETNSRHASESGTAPVSVSKIEEGRLRSRPRRRSRPNSSRPPGIATNVKSLVVGMRKSGCLLLLVRKTKASNRDTTALERASTIPATLSMTAISAGIRLRSSCACTTRSENAAAAADIAANSGALRPVCGGNRLATRTSPPSRRPTHCAAVAAFSDTHREWSTSFSTTSIGTSTQKGECVTPRLRRSDW